MIDECTFGVVREIRNFAAERLVRLTAKERAEVCSLLIVWCDERIQFSGYTMSEDGDWHRAPETDPAPVGLDDDA